MYNLTHTSQSTNSDLKPLQPRCEAGCSQAGKEFGRTAGLRDRKRPGHQATNHNHFPLDLRQLKGDTPPTQMLYPEMDSGPERAARVKEAETYLVCLIRLPSAASSNRSRTMEELRLRVAGELPV